MRYGLAARREALSFESDATPHVATGFGWAAKCLPAARKDDGERKPEQTALKK